MTNVDWEGALLLRPFFSQPLKSNVAHTHVVFDSLFFRFACVLAAAAIGEDV